MSRVWIPPHPMARRRLGVPWDRRDGSPDPGRAPSTRGGFATVLLGCLALLAGSGWLALASGAGEVERPNILWLTCEDAGPHLGCYGDPVATTPNLDALAARSLRFRRVWSTAPVCAPARTTIITGRYPSSTGSEHMRSLVPLPAGARMLPQWLREAGYHCSNNSKEDYNVAKPGLVWDESSARAHWRNRARGQPFFAVFNYTESHESQIRQPGHRFVHEPATMPIPPYMPDTPEVRAGWAQYHDQVSVIDARVGAALRELAEAGLAEDTIVMFYGDHGSGMPRNKRSACDSGLRVPLIVHFPPRWRHLAPPDYREGGESPRLVGFVDLVPTVLSLAGIPPPGDLPGRAFAGRHARAGSRYLFGLRGRMDERYDLVRSVTDGRFVYVRNYLPHRPHGQHNAYMFQTPATAAWKRRFDAGGLPPEQRAFWEPKEPEELYDLESDPFEIRNLAADSRHRSTLNRFRRVHRRHTLEIRDIDLMPEAEMLRRAGQGAPGDLARGESAVNLRAILEAAELAAERDPGDVPRLRRLTRDREASVRWWAATGLLIRGAGAAAAGRQELRELMERDPSMTVRIAASEALATFGEEADREAAIQALLRFADARQSDYFDAVAALNAIDQIPDRMRSRRVALEALPRQVPGVEPRVREHLDRLLSNILGSRPDDGAR